MATVDVAQEDLQLVEPEHAATRKALARQWVLRGALGLWIFFVVVRLQLVARLLLTLSEA